MNLSQNVLASFDVLGSGVYYIERLSGETRLQYFDFATRQSTTVARNLGNVDFGLSASPDGRAILFPAWTPRLTT